jgi:hypothetical protein
VIVVRFADDFGVGFDARIVRPPAFTLHHLCLDKG